MPPAAERGITREITALKPWSSYEWTTTYLYTKCWSIRRGLKVIISAVKRHRFFSLSTNLFQAPPEWCRIRGTRCNSEFTIKRGFSNSRIDLYAGWWTTTRNRGDEHIFRLFGRRGGSCNMTEVYCSPFTSSTMVTIMILGSVFCLLQTRMITVSVFVTRIPGPQHIRRPFVNGHEVCRRRPGPNERCVLMLVPSLALLIWHVLAGTEMISHDWSEVFIDMQQIRPTGAHWPIPDREAKPHPSSHTRRETALG